MNYDLWTEINELHSIIQDRIKYIARAGVECAETDAEYRKQLSIAMAEERAKGTPVTMLRDTCLGRPKIANLRMKRDMLDAKITAAREEIQSDKLRIRTLDDAIKREWSLPQDGGQFGN